MVEVVAQVVPVTNDKTFVAGPNYMGGVASALFKNADKGYSIVGNNVN